MDKNFHTNRLNTYLECKQLSNDEVVKKFITHINESIIDFEQENHLRLVNIDLMKRDFNYKTVINFKEVK